jgi:predicted phosphoribosyltransferase
VRGPVVVVALPRVGVPVGCEVARAMGVPLDVCVVRKLGVPGREELAMAAIASGGVVVINRDVVRTLGIPHQAIDQVATAKLKELERRDRVYREDLPPLNVPGAAVILVDDGLATGATIRAAVAAVRRRGAVSIAVAVPVASSDACRQLADEADDVVCLMRPDAFEAIGTGYEAFPQLTDDDDVRRLLTGCRRATAAR